MTKQRHAYTIQAMTLPPSKLSILKAHAARNDWRSALKVAAQFQQLGNEKAAITRAWQAIQSPEFYESIGQNPTQLIEAGIAALKTRYGC